MIRMDDAWLGVLAGKDYLFPTGWRATDWLVNLGYVPIVIAIFRMRQRAGVAVWGERGLVLGVLALVGMFAASVPLTAMRLALAVQLQVPRVFWILDLLATVYVVWLVAEAANAPARRAVLVAATIGVASLGRGMFVMAVGHPGRPLVQIDLPRNDWTDVMARVGELPVSTHVLADPGHAWKYGTSVRVAAARDVYLEEVKDAAVAMYSRELAERVGSRIRDLRNFSGLSDRDALALGRTYDLDVLVTEHVMPLREHYHNQRFHLYDLTASHRNGPAESQP
jgi:hypothetical protein